MPCYRPVTVFKPDDGGSISFREIKNSREIRIPCGKCIGCRIEITDAWAFRCMAEASLHKNNHFVTLTYDDDSLPADESLNHKDWQLFAHRVRKKLGPFRFFMCGEYGDNTQRPHYHALLFGLDIPDRVKCNSVYSSHDLYQSDTLCQLWGKGFITLGEVSHESAKYCATYALKRVSKELEAERYSWVTRYGELVVRKQPYGKMSLKPGIGAGWLEKYKTDVVNHGAVYQNQYAKKVPRYFCDLMEKIDPVGFESLQYTREEKAKKVFNPDDHTRVRLETKEAVAKARRKFNMEKRNHAL